MKFWPGAALMSVLLLAGCSATETVTGYFSKPVILSCPDYRILADAADYTTYRPGTGRDLIDVDGEFVCECHRNRAMFNVVVHGLCAAITLEL